MKRNPAIINKRRTMLLPSFAAPPGGGPARARAPDRCGWASILHPRSANSVIQDGRSAGEPAGGRWLEVAIVARGFSRNPTYNDQVSPGLRQYQLAVGPAAVV